MSQFLNRVLYGCESTFELCLVRLRINSRTLTWTVVCQLLNKEKQLTLATWDIQTATTIVTCFTQGAATNHSTTIQTKGNYQPKHRDPNKEQQLAVAERFIHTAATNYSKKVRTRSNNQLWQHDPYKGQLPTKAPRSIQRVTTNCGSTVHTKDSYQPQHRVPYEE